MVVDEVDQGIRRCQPDAVVLRTVAIVLGPLGVELLDLGGRSAAHEHVAEHLELLWKVEDRVEPSGLRVAPDQRVVAVESFTEEQEIVLPGGAKVVAQRGRELFPELVLDVFDRIDAVAIDVGEEHPVGEHADELAPHLGVLRVDVLQAAGEVTEDHLLGIVEVRHAPAPVVGRRVPKDRRPGRDAKDLGHVEELDWRITRLAERGKGLDAAWVVVRVVLGDAPERAGGARAEDALVGASVQVDVVVEDLPQVVGDDVDDHLDPPRVTGVDHRAQRGEIAKVRVQALEVDLPVAVVAVDARVAVHVEHDGADPERRDAELHQVVELIDDALVVAALIPREIARRDPHVVPRLAVGEAVGEELVDDLVAPVVHLGVDLDVLHCGQLVGRARERDEEEAEEKSLHCE